jgi:glutaredoxin-like protein NrdH
LTDYRRTFNVGALTRTFGTVWNGVVQRVPLVLDKRHVDRAGERKHAHAPFFAGKETIMTDKPVKVFSLSTCSHCKSTKRFLDECTVKYEFVDVDLLDGDERKAILADVKKFNPRCSFPTVIIGDNVIVGYKEDKIKEALGL